MLLSIKENSQSYPLSLIREGKELNKALFYDLISGALSSKVRRDLLEELLGSKCVYEYGIVCAYCYAVQELGLSKNVARNFVEKAFKRLLGLQVKPSSRAEECIIQSLYEIMEDPTQSEVFNIIHAYELGLVDWDERGWKLTKMGEALLRVTSLNFTKALLITEHLSGGSSRIVMPLSFLEQLYKMLSQRPVVGLHELYERVSYPEGQIALWIYRLSSLGIVQYEVGRRGEVIKRTTNTLNILSEVVNFENSPAYREVKSILRG